MTVRAQGGPGRREKKRAREEARFARFEAYRAELIAQGFAEKDCTVSILRANLLGLACALPFLAAAIVGAVLLPDKVLMCTGSLFSELFLLAAVFLVSLPAHEGLHALGWAAVRGSFRGIRFGVLGRSLSPYCAVEAPFTRGRYLVGSLAPFAVLGVGLCAAGLGTGLVPLVVYGAYNIACAGGDLLVALKVLCSRAERVLDHPVRCGFYAYCRAENARVPGSG